jgi:5-methylcytosine-specific restriction endonuclease McrA
MADSDSAPKIISRKDAKARGLKHYFTGKRCKRGHVAKRFVSTRSCVICSARHVANDRARNPETHRVRSRQEKARAYAADREKFLERERRKRNKDRAAYNEACRLRQARWAKNNPVEFKKRNKAKYRADPQKFKQRRKARDRDLKQRDPVAYSARNKKYKIGWKTRNPDAARLSAAIGGHNRKVRLSGRGVLSRADIYSRFELQGGKILSASGRVLPVGQRRPCKCAICGVETVWGAHEIDHIVSLVRGGRNERRNIQITCRVNRCNQQKHNKDQIEFMREQFGKLL